MKGARLLHDLSYAAQTVLLRRRLPYLFGIQVTDRCNLDCFYCEGKNAGRVHHAFDAAARIVEDAFARGHRALYITGGEPALWRDGDRTLADLVDRAFDIGYFSVLVYTNGTCPMNIPRAGYVVTIDGPRDAHNAIRSGTYDLIMDNASRATCAGLYASVTITRNNADRLEEFVRDIAAAGFFRGIMFNLLTHWPEVVAKHGLDREGKKKALDTLLRLKRAGYPVILSRAVHRALIANSWRRPIPQIELSIGDRVFTCCRDVENREVCGNCGYLGCAEISQVLALRPSALFEVLKLR